MICSRNIVVKDRNGSNTTLIQTGHVIDDMLLYGDVLYWVDYEGGNAWKRNVTSGLIDKVSNRSITKAKSLSLHQDKMLLFRQFFYHVFYTKFFDE